MKRIIGLWVSVVVLAAAVEWFSPNKAGAAIDTIEQPISGFSAPEAVSISTYAYVNATSAAVRIADLSGILIDNPSTNTATMHGHVGNCTSTAISTSTVKGPIEIAPTTNGSFIPLAEYECLWLVSRNTSAENVTVQGIKQRR